MTYRIPPIGYCARCLVLHEHKETPAYALWKGTGLCKAHLREVARVA